VKSDCLARQTHKEKVGNNIEVVTTRYTNPVKHKKKKRKNNKNLFAQETLWEAWTSTVKQKSETQSRRGDRESSQRLTNSSGGTIRRRSNLRSGGSTGPSRPYA